MANKDHDSTTGGSGEPHSGAQDLSADDLDMAVGGVVKQQHRVVAKEEHVKLKGPAEEREKFASPAREEKIKHK